VATRERERERERKRETFPPGCRHGAKDASGLKRSKGDPCGIRCFRQIREHSRSKTRISARVKEARRGPETPLPKRSDEEDSSPGRCRGKKNNPACTVGARGAKSAWRIEGAERGREGGRDDGGPKGSGTSKQNASVHLWRLSKQMTVLRRLRRSSARRDSSSSSSSSSSSICLVDTSQLTANHRE